MEKHKCRLCSRAFSNGRALGGHMKGHLATLPVPPKSAAAARRKFWPQDESSPPPPLPSSSQSTSSGEEKSGNYGLRENPRKSFKLADPEFSFAADPGSVAQDGESETESKNPTRQRSKVKNRNRTFSRVDSASSGCNTTQEEALAICLMMLSRDARGNRVEESGKEEVKVAKKARKNGKEIEGGERRFECPFCFRVFGSGQALGGHKRSHLLGSFPTHSNLRIFRQNLIVDLNLPAPLEDDGDDEYFTVLSDT